MSNRNLETDHFSAWGGGKSKNLGLGFACDHGLVFSFRNMPEGYESSGKLEWSIGHRTSKGAEP